MSRYRYVRLRDKRRALRRKATFLVESFIALVLSFNIGAVTDHFFFKSDVSKFKCATVQVFGNEDTYGGADADGNSLTVHNPTEVRCYNPMSDSMRPRSPLAER